MADKLYSHFVVVFNHQTKKWETDESVAQERFDDGTIYNESTLEWKKPWDCSKRVRIADQNAMSDLMLMLQKKNNPSGEKEDWVEKQWNAEQAARNRSKSL